MKGKCRKCQWKGEPRYVFGYAYCRECGHGLFSTDMGFGIIGRILRRLV